MSKAIGPKFRKAASLAQAAPPKSSDQLWAAVDYPQSGEVITCPQYTLRISAPGEASQVDVRLDQDAWQACRQSSGYWWYDWSGYAPGKHEIMLRVRGINARSWTSPPRRVQVELPSPEDG